MMLVLLRGRDWNTKMEDKILDFYKKLSEIDSFERMPSKWKLINPYKNHWNRFEFFIKKYYSHSGQRNLIIALNPGRFGCNKTGIALTDEHILSSKMSYPEEIASPITEKTATRIYSVITQQFPDLQQFFSNFFMTNIFPFGIVEKNKNVSFRELIKLPSIESFSKQFISESIKLFHPQRLICIGRGSEKFIHDNFPDIEKTYLHHPARTFPDKEKEKYKIVIKHK